MDLALPLADRVRQVMALPPAPAGEQVDGGHDVPAAVRAAAEDAVRRGETHYVDRPGILPLRRLVAEAIAGRFGLAVDAGNGVVITCGATEARFVAVQQLLPKGGTLVALAQPDRLAAACIVRQVNLAGPDAAVGGPTALFLDGATPAELSRSWLQRAKEHGWPVVFDAGDLPAAGQGGQHPAAAGLADQTVTVGSLGTAHGMAAWRLGFLAAPATTAGPLRDFKQALTICSASVSQWGALGLAEEPRAEGGTA